VGFEFIDLSELIRCLLVKPFADSEITRDPKRDTRINTTDG